MEDKVFIIHLEMVQNMIVGSYMYKCKYYEFGLARYIGSFLEFDIDLCRDKKILNRNPTETERKAILERAGTKYNLKNLTAISRGI